MMSTSTRLHGSPFTASQWQELEHQALIFKYMVSGMPIPSDLIFSIKTTNMLMDSSSSSSTRLFPHQPIGGRGYFEMGMGFGRIRKADPEPGRCRRTDGKKWRCSKEAYTDSKYCEKHMHRGRNRSRKPVEITPTPPTPSNIPSNSSLKPHGFDFSFQTSSNTDLALDSGSYSLLAHNKDCSRNKYFYGLKEEEEMETSRTLRGLPNSSFDQSQSLTDRFKDDRNRQREQQQYWFGLGSDFKSQRTVNRGGEEETQKPLRHFLSISMPISSPEFPDSNSRTPD